MMRFFSLISACTQRLFTQVGYASGSVAKSCPIKQPIGSSEPSEYVEE